MKKTAKIIVALGLVLALALLAGCGKKEEAKKIKVGASPRSEEHTSELQSR